MIALLVVSTFWLAEVARAQSSFEFTIEPGNAVYVCFDDGSKTCEPGDAFITADIESAVFSGTRLADVWTVENVNFDFGEPSGAILAAISMAYPLDATTPGCGAGIGPQGGLVGGLNRSSQPETLTFDATSQDCGVEDCTDFWVGVTYSTNGVAFSCEAAAAPVVLDWDDRGPAETLSGVFSVSFTASSFDLFGTTGEITFVPEPATAGLQGVSLVALALVRRLRRR